MSLKEKLRSELKTALKSKDKVRLATIRAIINGVKNFEINNKTELDDEGIEKIVANLVKQRKDSIEQFKAGKREDLAEKEEAELKILMEFLPEQLGEEDIEKIVKDTISELEPVTKKDFGKVMKTAMSKLQGKADGKIVNRIVKNLLQ